MIVKIFKDLQIEVGDKTEKFRILDIYPYLLYNTTEAEKYDLFHGGKGINDLFSVNYNNGQIEINVCTRTISDMFCLFEHFTERGWLRDINPFFLNHCKDWKSFGKWPDLVSCDDIIDILGENSLGLDLNSSDISEETRLASIKVGKLLSVDPRLSIYFRVSKKNFEKFKTDLKELPGFKIPWRYDLTTNYRIIK